MARSADHRSAVAANVLPELVWQSRSILGEDVASLRQGLPDRKRSAYCPLTAFSLFGCVAEREKPLEGFKMASRGFWRVLKGFITAIVFVKNLGACAD